MFQEGKAAFKFAAQSGYKGDVDECVNKNKQWND